MAHQEINQYIHRLYQDHINKKIKPYASAIKQYCQFIQEDLQDSIEYLFSILMDTGYLCFKGFDLPDSIYETVTKTFGLLVDMPKDMDMTSHIDITDLDVYDESFQEFQNIPTPDMRASLKQEQDWEDLFWQFEDQALEIVNTGLKIEAIKKGYDIYSSVLSQTSNFDQIWKSFNNIADGYITQLKSRYKSLYPFSQAIKEMVDHYPYLPDCSLKQIIQDIINYRETYPLEQKYRNVYSAEISDEIYLQIKDRFPTHIPASWVVLYKHALAEETLKKFIFNSLSHLISPDEFHIKSSLNTDFEHQQSVLQVQNKNFSVHILDNRHVGGWGIQKDHFNRFFQDSNDYLGALCCSMREYPNDNVLIRFENFLPKNQFAAWVNNKKERFEGYIKLPFSDVYANDQRQQFIEMVKNLLIVTYTIHLNEVLSDAKQPESQHILFQKQIACISILAIYLKSRISKGKQGEKDPPDYTVLYVPEDFQGVKTYNFLKPKNLKQLKRYMKSQINWKYFLIFLDHNGQAISKKVQPSNIDLIRGINATIPPETCIAFLCVGPGNQIDNIVDNQSPAEQPEGVDQQVFWVIYGPNH